SLAHRCTSEDAFATTGRRPFAATIRGRQFAEKSARLSHSGRPIVAAPGRPDRATRGRRRASISALAFAPPPENRSWPPRTMRPSPQAAGDADGPTAPASERRGPRSGHRALPLEYG